jgi:hypothetical protein
MSYRPNFHRKTQMNVPQATSKWQDRNSHSATSATVMRRCVTGLWVCLWFCSGNNVVSACPNCKDALAANHQDAAFALSILFMMAAPFTLMLIWATAIWRMRQQPSTTAVVVGNSGVTPALGEAEIAPPLSHSIKASAT